MPAAIVGNKSDLKETQRQVGIAEGQKLAEKLKCAFVEASARSDINVAKSFEQVIGQIEKAQNPNEPTGGSKCAVM